ncbi:cell division protein ZapE [Marinomonas transparens]|uniref:AFG1 family ATPase n=1 Tax=Marinomonas transparens TaxID=2795388 RepID=A0A934MX57_9GAMM|nr:cell division protein ZapE [Marinomonas transparens]MBJ7538944.1 AFG1 family ATPase [Marinomonas transparens]
MPSPLQLYQTRLNEHLVTYDEYQQSALLELERIYDQLIKRGERRKARGQVKGLYMWGDVGRGKTFLMDLFHESLPKELSLRLHFHHFMSRLHQELNLAFGLKNPLKAIAKRLASECQVLCFDEFFVADIADAMLLGGLTEALFEEGVVLVATSNIAIENLFQDQLEKVRFQPSIALLQNRLVSIHLSGEADHRLRHAGFSTIYFVQDERDMAMLFDQYSKGAVSQQALSVCHRSINVIQSSGNLAWFDFYDLCDGPRSALDYIELAQHYPYIMVTGIPELSSEPFEQIKARGTEDGAIGSGQTGERMVSLSINDDSVRRFISLVDECYDHQVVLLLNADVPLGTLYLNGALLFEFRRTYSRLIEMKSHYYQALRSKEPSK